MQRTCKRRRLNPIKRTRSASALLLGLLFLWLAASLPSAAQASGAGSANASTLGTVEQNAAFTLVGKIDVPDMTGTWDHLTLDPATNRLFASAQEDNQVRVFDLPARKPLYTIASGFNRPQGLLYMPGKKVLAVTNGTDGTLRFFNGTTYAPMTILPLSLGADMLAMDMRTKDLYVDHGGVDSHRGPGALAIVNTAQWKVIGQVPTEYRPGSMEVDQRSHRLFLTLPGLSQVAVIDLSSNAIVARYQLAKPASPIALALDVPHKRIFVGNRKPAFFNVLDMNTGKIIATLDSIDGIEGISVDARLHRIYLTALDGYVQVIQQIDPDHYKTIARFFTGHHAGTSQWVPGMNLFCVAVPPVDGQKSAIWLFRPKP